jgi:hypothetical protein
MCRHIRIHAHAHSQEQVRVLAAHVFFRLRLSTKTLQAWQRRVDVASKARTMQHVLSKRRMRSALVGWRYQTTLLVDARARWTRLMAVGPCFRAFRAVLMVRRNDAGLVRWMLGLWHEACGRCSGVCVRAAGQCCVLVCVCVCVCVKERNFFMSVLVLLLCMPITACMLICMVCRTFAY